jgi:hypothetical protein
LILELENVSSRSKGLSCSPLWAIDLNLVEGSLVVEEVFRPRREFLVPLVQVAAVVAEGAWPSWAITNSPHSCAPYIAVCASPCLSLAVSC